MEKQSKKTVVFAVIAFITVVIIQMIFTGMIYNTLSVYTSPILEEFGFARADYALSLTLMSAICAVANLFLGKLKAKINTRGVVIFGGVLMTVGLFIYSRSMNLAMFYIAALLVGVAFAFLASAIGATIINSWFAKYTGLLVGITIALAGAGGTIFSPVVGGWITNLGWRNSFMIVTIVSAICTVVIGLFFRSEPQTVGVKPLFFKESADSEKKADPLYGLTLKEGVKTVNFWATIVVWLIIGIVVYSIMQNITVFVQDLGYSAADAGLAIAPMYAVNTFMPLVIGFVSDLIDIKYVVACGLGLFTIATIILITNPSLGMLYVVACFTGVGIATGRSTLPMVTRKVFGTRDYASFIGIFVGVFSGGIAIGSYVIAAFYDAFGNYASAMYLYIPLAIISIVAVLILVGRPVKVKEAE